MTNSPTSRSFRRRGVPFAQVDRALSTPRPRPQQIKEFFKLFTLRPIETRANVRRNGEFSFEMRRQHPLQRRILGSHFYEDVICLLLDHELNVRTFTVSHAARETFDGN